MNAVVESFIKDLIQELKEINENKEYDGQSKLDIPYLVAPITQYLEECKEFVKDISNHSYYINGYEDDTTEGYTNGKIRILIGKHEDEKESEYMVDAYENYCYYIEFRFDERSWGYCECTPEDKDYNEEKSCCGHGCDFYAPAFSITKEYNLGFYNWNGDEHDLWKFEDKFYKDELELAEEKHARDIKNEIKRLEQIIKESREKLDIIKANSI